MSRAFMKEYHIQFGIAYCRFFHPPFADVFPQLPHLRANRTRCNANYTYKPHIVVLLYDNFWYKMNILDLLPFNRKLCHGKFMCFPLKILWPSLKLWTSYVESKKHFAVFSLLVITLFKGKVEQRLAL